MSFWSSANNFSDVRAVCLRLVILARLLHHVLGNQSVPFIKKCIHGLMASVRIAIFDTINGYVFFPSCTWGVNYLPCPPFQSGQVHVDGSSVIPIAIVITFFSTNPCANLSINLSANPARSTDARPRSKYSPNHFFTAGTVAGEPGLVLTSHCAELPPNDPPCQARHGGANPCPASFSGDT